jgi:oligopeptide transport system substrate-binding protein
MARLLALAAAATLFLAACSPAPNTPRLTHDATILNRGNGADISSLDPHYITGNWEAYVIGDCLVGLTTEDINGEPMPGAAKSWETSKDGLTWTFHLRDHVWSDGVPVTAEDFVYAWRRILEPARGAPYAYYLWIVKNAQAVNNGKLPASALGIAAKDDKTVVVTLEHPAPYLPEWLMHQTVLPVPRHVLLVKGDAWSSPSNYVANGPYVPKEWVPNDRVVLVKNPRFYDAAHVRIQTVNYYPTQDVVAALKLLRSGAIDTQEPLPVSEIEWLRKNMPEDIQLYPNLSNSYVVFNFQRPLLQDKRVREAMNLAYDRETLTYKVLKLGDPPAYAFIPPGTANYPAGASLDFKSMPFAQRLAKAQALMAEMGYGPSNHLRIGYSTTVNPDTLRTAAAFQAMMHRIYIDLDIIQMDSAVFYKTLSQHQFDTAGSAWIGDFNDASTFLDLLETNAGNNYGSYSSPKFDRLYELSKQEPDIKKRGELMRQAEQVALDDYAVLPTRFRQSEDLVAPYVKGWTTKLPNIRNFHRTRWLWIDPAAAR